MALTGKGRISQKMRDNVHRAVEELGYVYNQSAANLRQKRSNIVGMVTPDITNPFYSEMIAGLSHYLEENDALLFLANSEESLERQNKFLDSLLSQNAGGVVMCPVTELTQVTLRLFRREGFPLF